MTTMRKTGTLMATMATALLATVMVVACFQSTAYFRYFSTNIKGWQRDSVLHYHVPAVEENGYYVEEIGVRACKQYPFRQLSLVVDQKVISTNDSHSNIFKTDTLTFDIFDEMGKIKGKGVNLYQIVIPFKSLKLQKGDSISMDIHHNLSRFSVNGISDVGLKVTKAYSE